VRDQKAPPGRTGACRSYSPPITGLPLRPMAVTPLAATCDEPWKARMMSPMLRHGCRLTWLDARLGGFVSTPGLHGYGNAQGLTPHNSLRHQNAQSLALRTRTSSDPCFAASPASPNTLLGVGRPGSGPSVLKLHGITLHAAARETNQMAKTPPLMRLVWVLRPRLL
jgi:hypothetical protein